jgi:hypothetical protein
MNTPIDLKEIERKAFRSTYQDGLWDIYYGLIVIAMSIFVYRPPEGYSPRNIILMVVLFALGYGLFWSGKKFITLPRMGKVTFGAIRKKKRSAMMIILGIFIIFQLVLLAATAFGWFDPKASQLLNKFLPNGDGGLLIVSLIGSLILGISMIVIFYFTDFPRGYYIALMMSLAVFLMIFLNQPIYPILIGVLIILPGLVLFTRFLKRYPLDRQEPSNE